MKLKEVPKEYRIAFRHNPKEFYPNSFRIEAEEKRLVLVGVVKRHIAKGGKKFRVVGILKKKR